MSVRGKSGVWLAGLNKFYAGVMVFTHSGGYLASGLAFFFWVSRAKTALASPIARAVAAFLIYGTVLSFFAENRPLAFSVMFGYFCHWLLPFVLGYCVSVEKNKPEGAMVFFYVFAALTVFAIAAYFGAFPKHFGSFYLVDENLLKGLRHHIGYAAMLSVASSVFVSLGIFSVESSSRRRAFYAASGAMCAFAILLTGSRGYYIAFAAAAFAYLGWLAAARRKYLPSLVAFLAVLAISYAGYEKIPDARERVASALGGGDNSVMERLAIYKTAVSMIKDNLFFGVGPGQSVYKKKYFEAAGLDFYRSDGKPQHVHMHSMYLHVLAEFGALGFALFAWISFLLFRALKNNFSARTGHVRALAVGLLFGLAAVYIGEIFDTHLRGPGVAMELFWLVGLLSGIRK